MIMGLIPYSMCLQPQGQTCCTILRPRLAMGFITQARASMDQNTIKWHHLAMQELQCLRLALTQIKACVPSVNVFKTPFRNGILYRTYILHDATQDGKHESNSCSRPNEAKQ